METLDEVLHSVRLG